MNNNKKIITGVIAIIVAIGLFYGGVKYGEAQGTVGTAAAGQFGNRAGGVFGQRTGGAGARGGAAGGFVAGSILSKNDTSITVQIMGGGSKIVFTSASTTVAKSVTGSMSDLSVGTNVIVQGSTNSDGSVTARSIQIRPADAGPRPQQ